MVRVEGLPCRSTRQSKRYYRPTDLSKVNQARYILVGMKFVDGSPYSGEFERYVHILLKTNFNYRDTVGAKECRFGALQYDLLVFDNLTLYE